MMLGLARLYFPIFEEMLDKYNLPVELKYLAIIESALNPVAVSRAGATGLWQFMPATGKMYGLDISRD
ncbi:transglycosylase SLT domain-containing protein, partial [Klebsiella variicola]|uniref:transglycosylase SLT domain-containing protein n=1 Tax=Klebsiella variicola TaxID=244366 RepID=UPI0027301E55